MQTGCLAVLAFVAVAFALHYSRSILVPFVLALFLSYLFSPVVETLEQRSKAPRWLALSCTLLLSLVCLLALTLLFIGNVRELAEGTEIYRERIIALAQQVSSWTSQLGVPIETETLVDSVRNIPVFSIAGGLAGKLFGLLKTGSLCLIFLIFVISSRPVQTSSEIYTEIDRQIRKYLITKVTTSSITAVLVGTVLMIFGVELAMLFAVLTFLLNFIPTLGSIFATLAPIPIVFLQFSSWPTMLAAILIPGSIQFIIGNLLEPKLMGRSLDLHPATVLLSLMFWGLLWGTVGMILSVPMTVVLKIIFERIETTRPITELMAGRLPS